MKEPTCFPWSCDVDVGILSRLFDNRTNSYKFLFFLAILDRLESANFDSSVPMILDDLITDMLALAWYPHVYFRLSFGKQDQVTTELEAISTDSVRKGASQKRTERDALRAILANRQSVQLLARYVPYRLIRPFFAAQTSRLKDHAVNGRVAELASEYFSDARPLYRFADGGRLIVIHPRWCDYLKYNFPVVKGWARWKWFQYMQRVNPSVPSLGLKLFPPPERASLRKQTQYWRLVISHSTVFCIYSGQPLRLDQFALDHFLPWSFMVSDNLWNLIPVVPEANSAKSDKLPHERYLTALIDVQHSGLKVTHDSLPLIEWLDYAQSFLVDLRIASKDDLLDRNRLHNAYETNFLPLLTLATVNGFEKGWTYHS